MKHAILAPSSSEKWLNCPGSALLEKQMPGGGDEAAYEGTCAHFLAAHCLDTYRDQPDVPPSHIGRKIIVSKIGEEEGAVWCNSESPPGVALYAYTVDHWMRECVAKYINYVHRFVTPGTLFFVEQPFDLGHLTGENGAEGTPDCVLVDDDKIHVFDLKYGRTEVYAPGNTQLLMYAAIVSRHFEREGRPNRAITTHIYQPQIGNISTHQVTPGELDAFTLRVQVQAATARKVLDGVATSEEDFNAGVWCGTGHCAARHSCAACARYIEEQFITPHPTPLSHDEMGLTMTEEQAVNIWRHRKLLRGLVDGVEEYLKTEAQKGRHFPGVKLVRGKKPARKWRDEEEATQALQKMRIKSEVKFPAKLASPTQLEQAHKQDLISKAQWGSISELIVQPPAGLKVVEDKDTAPSVTPSADVFDCLATGDEPPQAAFDIFSK